MWRPENWGPGVKGKGDLEPSDPDAFFIGYKNFINHYADIAQNTGVEMLSIGNEMILLRRKTCLKIQRLIRQPDGGCDKFSETALQWNPDIQCFMHGRKTMRPTGHQILDDLMSSDGNGMSPIASREHEISSCP